MKRIALAGMVIGLALTGCSASPQQSSPPELVPESALDGLLLSADDVDSIMGASGMTAHPRVEVMADHRNMLSNLNCLGIWQVNESAVYGTDGWNSLRQALLKAPDTDAWQNLVVQSVVNYSSVDAAQGFFDQSSERWSQCTNHNINITLNGQVLPKWKSGELTATASDLAIPFTRDNANGIVDVCQRVLAIENNVIIDVQACKRDSETVTEALDVADEIKAKLPQ